MYIEGTVIVFIGHILCKRKMNEQRVEHGRREKDYKKEIVACGSQVLHSLRRLYTSYISNRSCVGHRSLKFTLSNLEYESLGLKDSDNNHICKSDLPISTAANLKVKNL